MDGDHVYCIRGISRFPDIDNYVTFVWLLKTYQIDRTGAGLFDLTLTQLDVNTQLYLRRTFGCQLNSRSRHKYCVASKERLLGPGLN